MLTSMRGLVAATLLAGSSFAAMPALADETDPPSEITITGNVAMVSDYRFRGLSLSGGDPAIQGGINVNHKSGLYVGVWGSNLEEGLGYGNLETDIFVGWTGALGSGVTADVGVLYYAYFNSGVGDDLNVIEPYASLSTTMGPVSAKLGVAYAPKQQSLDYFDLDGDGEGEDNLYVYADLGAGIPNTPVSLSAHVGYTSGALSPKLLSSALATPLTPDFRGGFDYSVGATFAITKNLSISASYVGVDGVSLNDFSNDAVVGTLKLSF
jgi:uncharacterized protein (TIGR02001 family)